ncbi:MULTISPECIES: DNA helicase RecQ [Clostridium]|jgi:ATP-dependent DNA helicase RecQ|uniref:DNA helicase RecQ n=1 Tax=Clostridium TaxID=1485 RepID=UPI000DD089F8|nr:MULTISPECIES: DNA helicase RecQ [Clostridium]MDB1933374.1 DNA helicase RecQ [Clostridium tertium]MDB1937478.1 DNA helicase RecQ [Clostridium tertium]MDB1955796.1 DNA helicase RecQ [Clostridium tertium]MDB1960230.1 DNA helicase RecQ [Clostridium tertium]MDB1964001.1 DNA helicase RecQ [Clostridium tertium]
MKNRGLEILEKYYGYKSFRRGQENIINSILSGNDVLAIMPTGGGKSICYQIPALLLDGVTIVISPLISLMKDQVDAIKEMGIESTYINSSLTSKEFEEIITNVKENKYKIVYVAPERLESYEFIMAITECRISQIAIDEAHCVSQWGHDFRSSYRRIKNFIEMLNIRPIVTAFTATATEEVKGDIINLLGLRDPSLFVTGFDRENLFINIEKGNDKKSYILKYIEENRDSSGIIYAATRKEVDYIYELLTSNGYKAGRYHAGLNDELRKENQEDFIKDKINIMVATNAFGMGIDKPNIRFVIHYNMPKNIEGYYQEIGRAGRDGEKSECILLFSPSDIHTQKYLIEVSTENIERKNNQYLKLKQMVDLIYSNDCYRKYILNYFGESVSEDCNNCSSCLSEGELVDKTIDAQKVLSCIYRMKKSFGVAMVVDVLRGSKNSKVINAKFNELSTYGIMKDYSSDELKVFINTLISHGYIDYVEGTYPVIKLNNKSIKVIKGEENVQFKEVKIKSTSNDNNTLFEILRELRFNIANEEGVPPYIIFGDNTLREMSTKYPLNLEELMNISGVGEVKLNKYGEIFINTIKDYVDENNIKIVNNEYKKKNEEVYLNVESNKELLSRLKVIRREFANKENSLPQAILSLNTLKEISGRFPLNLEELKDISGIGPKKITKYGDEIIEEVRRFVVEKDLNIVFEEKGKRKVIIDGEKRSNEEIAIDMIKDGVNLDLISENIEVSISTILGYVTDYIKENGEFSISLNLNKYYNHDDKEKILKACEVNGYEKVSILKKYLPDNIKYESIRAVILEEYFKVS